MFLLWENLVLFFFFYIVVATKFSSQEPTHSYILHADKYLYLYTYKHKCAAASEHNSCRSAKRIHHFMTECVHVFVSVSVCVTCFVLTAQVYARAMHHHCLVRTFTYHIHLGCCCYCCYMSCHSLHTFFCFVFFCCLPAHTCMGFISCFLYIFFALKDNDNTNIKHPLHRNTHTHTWTRT